jgi:hypothetical protein
MNNETTKYTSRLSYANPSEPLNAALSNYDPRFERVMIYDMIYLFNAIGLPPGGSSTVQIYTQTIHRTTQNKQYIEQHNFGSVRAVPRLGELYPGICLTTEEKARKKNSFRIAEQ